MKIKYAIARIERQNNEVKHLPVLEFDSYESALESLNKVKSNKYMLLPIVID